MVASVSMKKRNADGKLYTLATHGVYEAVMAMIQVPSYIRDDPPHRGHDQPGDGVGEGENEKVPAPLQVHERGEQVR